HLFDRANGLVGVLTTAPRPATVTARADAPMGALMRRRGGALDALQVFIEVVRQGRGMQSGTVRGARARVAAGARRRGKSRGADPMTSRAGQRRGRGTEVVRPEAAVRHAVREPHLVVALAVGQAAVVAADHRADRVADVQSELEA
ncbi:MAG: hypothetical protein ACFCUN_01430, partial [Hyphomicrobiaceae bacterium]